MVSMENTFDQKKIGRHLPGWGDSKVFQYGNNQVIKFSKIVAPVIGEKYYDRIVNNQYNAVRHFKEMVVPIILIKHPQKPLRALLQQYINGEEFTKKSLKNKDIREQFYTIIKAHNDFKEEQKYPLDIMGHEGATKGILGNIIITKQGELKLFDTATVYDPRGYGVLNIITYPLFWIARIRQRHIVKKYQKAAKQWEDNEQNT